METQNVQSAPDDLTVATSSQQQQQPSSNNPNLIELNETVNRIASHSGVEIVQILNTNGDIMAECNNMRSIGKTPTATSTDNSTITPDFDETIIQNTANSSTTTTTISTSISTASTARKLLQTAQTYIQQLNDEAESNDEITFIEIRSKNGYELMIAPHYGFALIVIKRS